jgi:hypothetical protein
MQCQLTFSKLRPESNEEIIIPKDCQNVPDKPGNPDGAGAMLRRQLGFAGPAAR